MTTSELEGVPEGWQAVRYGYPKTGENYLWKGVVRSCAMGVGPAKHLVIKPKPWTPTNGDLCYLVAAREGYFVVREYYWGNHLDEIYWENNRVYRTAEEAADAVLAIKEALKNFKEKTNEHT